MEKSVLCGGLSFTLSGTDVAKAELTNIGRQGQVQLFKISLAWAERTIPEPFTIICDVECTDVYSVWAPRTMATQAAWGGVFVNARLAGDSPVLAMTAKNGENRCTLALSDPKTPIRLEVKTMLDGFLRHQIITLFADKTGPFTTYDVILRVDCTSLPFSQAVQSVREWYTSLGYVSVTAPSAAFDAVYSTWYSYLQKVTQADVIRECRLAAKLGMKTVIVDDGWQKDDHPSVYGFTGDWQPCAHKFPDMVALSDAIHALGMKFVLWFAVPFVGEYAQNYAKFSAMYLNEVKGCDCSVLDPRYPAVRQFIIDTYVDALQKWHLDGFKLDFIDRFKTNGEVKPEMDFVSVEEATEVLLVDVMRALVAVKSDVLLEFRQPYAGVVPQRFGNMFRVWDCPNDGFTNRVQTLNMRLLNGNGAIHSDMIGCSANETVENFATQLIGTLFSVPQISFRLAGLSLAHSTVLTQYLAFWTAHRKTLMHGKLSVQNPELYFAYATAESESESISVNMSGQLVTAVPGKITYCFNLSAQSSLPIQLSAPAKVMVTDCLGQILSTQMLSDGMHLIAVPLCGLMTII